MPRLQREIERDNQVIEDLELHIQDFLADTVSKHGGIAAAIDCADGAEELGAAEELSGGGASHGLQACTVGASDRLPGEDGARRLGASS